MSGESHDPYYRNWQTQDQGTRNNGQRAVWALPYSFDNSTGDTDSWRAFSEFSPQQTGLPRNPAQPLSPFRIIVLDENQMHQRLQQMLNSRPLPGSQQWQRGPSSPQGLESGLAGINFKKAMSKMRNQIFSPTYPRRKAYKTGLFNKQTDFNYSHEEDDDNDEGRECSICLEEFVPNEKLLVTPCNHMFHKDCLVPWVKAHGKCPVCRSMFCEDAGETSFHSTPGNLSNSRNVPDPNWGIQWSFFQH